MADPNSIPQRDIDRFWSHVQRGDAEACWPWTASRATHGYGQVMVCGRMQRTHRAAWLIAHGPIPKGLLVCHRCDNPPCCNPAHLFLGTHAHNMADMLAKRREARGERCGAAKLTAEQVAEIKSLFGKMKQNDIAQRFGVNKSAISKIKHGHLWVHVSARVS